jgi:hypothetical protein
MIEDAKEGIRSCESIWYGMMLNGYFNNISVI